MPRPQQVAGRIERAEQGIAVTEELLLLIVDTDGMVEISLAVDQLRKFDHFVRRLPHNRHAGRRERRLGILALAGHVDAVARIRLVDDIAIGGLIREIDHLGKRNIERGGDARSARRTTRQIDGPESDVGILLVGLRALLGKGRRRSHVDAAFVHIDRNRPPLRNGRRRDRRDIDRRKAYRSRTARFIDESAPFVEEERVDLVVLFTRLKQHRRNDDQPHEDFHCQIFHLYKATRYFQKYLQIYQKAENNPLHCQIICA